MWKNIQMNESDKINKKWLQINNGTKTNDSYQSHILAPWLQKSMEGFKLSYLKGAALLLWDYQEIWLSPFSNQHTKNKDKETHSMIEKNLTPSKSRSCWN